MPRRHKRNLTAWQQNWVTSQESFTPLLADYIAPVVIVDDQRENAPIAGAQDRLIAWGGIAVPVPAVGEHAALRIQVRGEGIRIHSMYATPNRDLRVIFRTAPAAFSNPVVFTPNSIRSGRPGQDAIESIWAHGGFLAASVTTDHHTIEFVGAPAAALSVFSPNPLPVPPGADVYIVEGAINVAMQLSFHVEEVPRR